MTNPRDWAAVTAAVERALREGGAAWRARVEGMEAWQWGPSWILRKALLDGGALAPATCQHGHVLGQCPTGWDCCEPLFPGESLPDIGHRDLTTDDVVESEAELLGGWGTEGAP